MSHIRVGLLSLAGMATLFISTCLFLVYVVSPLMFHGDLRWTPTHIAQSQRAGETIIDALEQYKADRGDYPAALVELVPTYLAEVPLPSTGIRKWEYSRRPSNYELRFSCTKEYPYCVYIPDYGWYKNQ